MSQRNGDKARFDRLRKKKAVHRDRIRELRKQMAGGVKADGTKHGRAPAAQASRPS